MSAPIRIFLFCIALFFFQFNARCQDYFTNGNATRLTNSDCYRLTQASNNQNGSVWYSDKLDLLRDFKLEFNMNFGNQDGNGADGIVFVLQTVGTKALGTNGGGMGFTGFSPAFGIEFDTYQNTSEGDPSYDHVAFIKNGINNHNSTSNLAGPVQTSKTNGNVEDGKDHLVVVQWTAASNIMQIYFDCELRLTAQIDLVKTIFNNKTEVFWGFTAATGGAANNQTVCLRKDIILKDSFVICNGEFIQISAGLAADNQYSWTPNQNINNSNIQKPIVNPSKSGHYIASYKNYCNQIIKDSIWIEVNPGPKFNLGKDTMLCEGTAINLDAYSADAKTYIWDDASTNNKRIINKAGTFWVKAINGNCTYIDSIIISGINRPAVNLGKDTTLCEGQNLRYNLNPNFDYLWHDNDKSASRVFTTSGTYWVNASNVCGLVSDTIKLRVIISPEINLGNDTSLCLGESILIQINDSTLTSFLWQDGSSTDSLLVTQQGKYYVEVALSNGCKGADTIEVSYIDPPSANWPTDTIVCRNEILKLEVIGKELVVFWNGTPGENTFMVSNYDGWVNMQASNICGSVGKQINVGTKNCFCKVYYPNAISVNDDLLNETFKPVYDCIWQEYNLQIFNRWGELLFETNDPKKSWNGKYKNTRVAKDYYVWIATYTALENTIPTVFMQKGIVYVLD
jgi:gliding motility-associated-like protein